MATVIRTTEEQEQDNKNKNNIQDEENVATVGKVF